MEGFFSHTITSRPGSRRPCSATEFRSTASTTLNMAVLAPIPSASAITAAAVGPGLLRNVRIA